MAQYTTGQYKLGEKYLYYVKGQNISSYHSVPDPMVPEAQNFFTNAYAVRITTIEDLDAIHVSAAQYFGRPQKDDISQAAVNRAVSIATNYTPYNNQVGSWTPDKFNALPYVSVPPNVTYGQPPPVVAAAAQPTADTAAATPPTPAAQSAAAPTPTSATQPGQPVTPATIPWYVQYKWPLIIGGVLIAGMIIWKITRKK